MSLTLMPVRAGGLARARVDARLSGFFSSAHPPIQTAAPEISEVLRKSRREYRDRMRSFMRSSTGRQKERPEGNVIRAAQARSSGMLRQPSCAVECRVENQIAGGRKA